MDRKHTLSEQLSYLSGIEKKPEEVLAKEPGKVEGRIRVVL